MSGGSLSTLLSLMSTYGISWILLGNPWSLTSKSRTRPSSSEPFLSKIFGYRSIPGLGTVSTSFLSIANESLAHRSASLQPEIYGQSFHLHEYLPVASFLAAVSVHFLTRLGVLLFALQPLRWLFTKLIPAPGTGPDLTTAHIEQQTFRALGTAKASQGSKALATFLYEGSLYYCSAFMGVEAAAVIRGTEQTAAHRLGGGILTPATLNLPFIEKIRDAGVKLDVINVD